MIVDEDDDLLLRHTSASQQYSKCTKRRFSSVSTTKSRSVMLLIFDICVCYLFVCET